TALRDLDDLDEHDDLGSGPKLARTNPDADEAARARRFEAMFDECYDLVWRTLRRLGVPDAHTDDAAQRVFVVAARRLDEVMIGHERRYLCGIAARVASEVRRRDPARRETNGEETFAMLADDAPGPEETLLEDEARAALDLTLAGMQEDLREVLVLV